MLFISCCKHANIQFEYTHCYYILQVCGGLNKEKWLDDEIRWKIGIGDKVRFWVDTWLEGNFGKLASKVIFNLGTKVGGGGEYGSLEVMTYGLGSLKGEENLLSGRWGYVFTTNNSFGNCAGT